MDDLPLSQAFAFAAWSTEHQPFGDVVRSSDGYIALQITALLNLKT